MSRPAAEAQLALMMLSRLPAGQIGAPAPSIGEAAWAFPLVGGLIGGLAGLVFWVASSTGLPPLAAAFLAIGAAALLTGALHEDGLADVADGFGGGSEKARKLEIMRDSRIGSYGVVALILVLGLTASAITAIGSLAEFIAIGALSRTAMLVPMGLLRPARRDGLGHGATLRLDTRHVIAVLLTLALTWPILGFVPLLVGLVATLAMTVLARAQIGGQTGDVLGATQKISECALWLATAALAA